MEQPLKTPRRPLAAALLAACALYPAPRALQAAHPLQIPPPPVPIRWTVETSRAQVAQFEAYRGETLLLEAEMRSYGKPFSEVLQPDLYWQTNGMGNAWWKAPATFEGNVCRAFWTPTNDCGAAAYNCFIGGPDATYRAAFRLRMLPSPGFTPNHIPLPTVKAESDPFFSAWLATNEFSSAGVDTNAVNDLITSATNGLATAADLGGYLPLYGGTLTGDLAVGEEHTASRKITVSAENGSNGITLQGGTSTGSGSSVIVGGSTVGGGRISIQGGGSSGGRLYVGGLTGAGGGAIEVDGMGASIKKDGSEVATESYVNDKVSGVSVTLTTLAGAVNSKADKTNVYTKEEVDEKVDAVDNKADEAYSAADQMVDAVNSLAGTIGTHIRDTKNPHKVTAAQVGAATPEDVSAAADSAVATANAYTDGQTTPLWSYLGAESFRVVVTNYDSAVHPPVASFEYRMTTNEAFRTVWNETNGQNRAIATATNLAHQAAKQLVDDPANRAWGKYDSETGEASPEGVIQATAPGGLIVGGGQRWSQISAESGWWIITSTDPTLCRTGTNGVFSIIGSDGQEAIRIVKGDKVTVPAPADSISVASGVCTVTYAVEAEQHPTARFASELGGDAGTVWYNEDDADCPVTMTWSGTSGNYVLTFDTAGLSAGFVQATYEQGQESYTSFGGAGLELTKIRIGGKVYTVGTATIDGKTVLTLE